MSAPAIMGVVRRFFGYGNSVLFVSVGLILATAVSAREMALHILHWMDTTQSSMSSALSSTFEPRRGDTQFGVLATVLGPLNAKTTSTCSDVDVTANDLDKVAERARLFFRAIDTDELANLDPQTREHVKLAQDARASSKVHAVASGPPHFGPCPGNDVPRMLCAIPDPDPRLRTRIMITPPPGTFGAWGARDIDVETTAEATASLLFDDAVRSVFPEDKMSGVPAEVTALYFIGPHDTFRLWRRSELPERLGEEFNELRRWATQEYVERFLREPKCKRYHSQIYIDYLRAGPIRTICQRVEDGVRALVGVACRDEAVPRGEVVEAVEAAGLLQHETIQFGIEPQQCRIDKEAQGGESAQRNVNGPTCELRHGATSSMHPSARTIETLESFSYGDEEVHRAWLVPLGDAGPSVKPGWRHGLVIWAPIEVTTRIKAWSLATIVLFLVTVFVVVAGVHRVRGGDAEERVQSVLRSLQVGVTRQDERDRIIGANDRAEEIFDSPLPRLGADVEQENSFAFSDLIDQVIVEELEDGRLKAGRYMEVIPRKRSVGSPSAYFARVLRNGAWIQCIGTPLFVLDERLHDIDGPPCTFGVTWRVPDGARLDQIREVYNDATLPRWLCWDPTNPRGRAFPSNAAACSALLSFDDAGRPDEMGGDERSVALEELVDLHHLYDESLGEVGWAAALGSVDRLRDSAVKRRGGAVHLYARLGGRRDGSWFKLKVWWPAGAIGEDGASAERSYATLLFEELAFDARELASLRLLSSRSAP